MADSKITALTSIGTSTDPAVDPLVLVDVSDTSMAATGTTKKVTLNQLLSSNPSATGGLTLSGALAAGSATITGDLTVKTNVLKVDTTNNRVGIGTASPAQTLDVAGPVRANASFNTTDGTNTGVFGTNVLASGVIGITAGTNVPLLFGTNSTERARLDTSGNLGLGVTPSAWLASSYKALQLNTTGVIAGYGSGSNQSTRIANNWFSNASGVDTYITNNFATVYQQNAGVHSWYTAASGTAGTAITDFATPVMTLNANAALVLKGGNASANGVGIAFPATKAASSDANTLDDYEEGTWTGTLKGSVADPTTPVTATGRYTKIGRVVTVNIDFGVFNSTGASGNATVTGLPFANGLLSCGTVESGSALTFSGTLVADVSTGGTTIQLQSITSNAYAAFATHNAGATRYLTISLTYTV